MTNNKILFIFEGESTEKKIANNLSKYFVNKNTIIQCAFCSDIYQFYDKLQKDEDLDAFSVLKKIKQNSSILSSYSRSDFAEIYMFFDYDGHANCANDKKLSDLLYFFDNETESGKLFISYPMVEAIRHVSKKIDFKNLKVKAKENIRYKNLVHREGYYHLRNIENFSIINWEKIINFHLSKLNFIVNNCYCWPTYYINQLSIFNKQIEKFISVDLTVSVLSSFPVFLFDYYGHDGLKNVIRVEILKKNK